MSTSASHFRLKLICPFYFFPIIAKVHKAAGVSRKATKRRQKRFLSILLDYWISTAKFIPLYGKERSLFLTLLYYKKKEHSSKKSRATFSLCCSLMGTSIHSIFCPFVCEEAACMHSVGPAKICALCRHGFKS